MAIGYKQFSDKYDLLPPEAQFYFSNEFSGKLILDLAKNYNIKADYVYDLVFDTVNQDFDFDYVHRELLNLNLPGLKNDDFFKDFIGEIFLPLSPYIKSKDIKKELIKNGGALGKYQANANNFLSLIEDENLKNLDSLISLHEKTVNPKEEKNYVLDLLTNHVLEVLRSSSTEAAADLNSGLIYLFNTDENFKIEAPRALLDNGNRLTSANLLSTDKEVAPTVGNWLKDFIKENGNEMFNELTLAQYLSSSINTKKLNPEEKKILSQLLKLYRNLAFFPDSMENLPTEDWQIIPLNAKNDDREVPKASLNIKQASVKRANIDTVKKNNSDPEGASNELQELQTQLLAYPENSFEYKALKQEIERFRKKTKI